MRVFRLVKARHAGTALDGEGARLAGGRWNSPGMPVVYCASSLSLAVLELLAHVDPGDLPEDLVAIGIEIPDALAMRRLGVRDLPADWRQDTGKAALRALAADWLRARAEAVLVVPSVIVPAELNVLVDPRHPDAAGIRAVAREPFRLDPRLRLR